MAVSLRRPGKEPDGSFVARSGTRFSAHSGTDGYRQRMEHGETADYPVAYVIGSGRHASGYLVQLGGRLFQSPLCYYKDRHAYDLAPGYERIDDPDFTRPVGEQCLLCHSSVIDSGYVAISCERCHGAVEEHLRRPVPGSR